MGYWGLLQMNQTKYCCQDFMGIFKECGKHPSVGCNYHISSNCQDEAWVQKPIFNNRSGYFNKNFSTWKSKLERAYNEARPSSIS